MSLFGYFSSNIELPQSIPLSTTKLSTEQVDVPANYTPLILGKLGNRLEGYATSFSSSIRKLEESPGELQDVLNKMNDLMQASYQGKSVNISHEILLLGGKLKELQVRATQLNQEGKLSELEICQFFDIANGFQSVLSAMQDWMCFQERYHAINEQLCQSLERMQPSVYNDLHGWSPLALSAMIESLNQMMKLIEISDPILQQNGVFASDLLKQLGEDIHAASWGCSDWFHSINQHFQSVLTTTKRQWESAKQAFVQTEDSLEAYSEMLVAAEQLLSMKQMLLEMGNMKFPHLQAMADAISKEMQAMSALDEDYTVKKNLKRNLEALAQAIPQVQAALPDQLKQVNAASHLIENTLAAVGKNCVGIDFTSSVERILKEYETSEEAELDRYITAKAKLKGIFALPDSKELYPKVHAFCQAKELQLSKKEPIDFEELVLARMIKTGQPQPGLLSRIWNTVTDPSSWSERTKYWVHVAGLGIQLADHLSKIGPTVARKEAPKLTKEQIELLDQETSYLGTILTDKYKVLPILLKDSAFIDRLNKKAPEIIPVLKEIIQHPSTPVDAKAIMNGYRAYRQEMLMTGKRGDVEWVTKAATASQRIEKAALSTIASTGSFQTQSLSAAKQEAVSELTEAMQTAKHLKQQLKQCDRAEFLRPKLPTTPHALVSLREEVGLLRKTLSESLINKPAESSLAPDWMEWNQTVQSQRLQLKSLEGLVADAMSAYEEAVAMQDYQAFSLFDVFGNKHKNLIKQGFIAEALGLTNVEVPAPMAVSSHQVLKFLKTYVPEIFNEWEQLKKYEKSADLLEKEEVIAHLKAIEAGIQKAFVIAAEDETVFRSLVSPEFIAWLGKLKESGADLMVRSTGDEDSKQSTNAGGNASIAYVKPDQKDICQAFGEVVSSYFGTGSLQKRLNANLNPFKEELRAAVTAQELIGEPLGGAQDPSQIPISLVLFTSEPLYVGKEQFRAMRISATYGHGEGVVGNQGIATDTALILISASDPSKLYILYDNQEKPERLAPVLDDSGKVVLQKVANSEEMANRRALDDDLLIRLYEWGVIGEKFFGDEPTDMEIVVKGKIYPVQARPINRPKLLASYIDLKKISTLAVSPIEKTLNTEMIVPGKGAAVKITSSGELLIEDTLEIAEKKFKKGLYKLIVVGQPEPSNSHPVVNFSGLGMPCFYSNILAAMRDLAKEITPERQLAVCVQSSTVSLWDTTKGAIEDYISEGFVVHPAKIAFSFDFKESLVKKLGVNDAIPEAILQRLVALRTATTNEEALKHLLALQQEPWILGLQKKINELKDKSIKQPFFGKIAQPIILAAELLQNKIQEVCLHIEALLEKQKNTGQLELLLPVKILGTLLFQQPSPGAIAQFSLLHLQESFAALDALLLYQGQLSHQAHFADILMDGTQSPVEEVLTEWTDFLFKLEPIAEKTLNGETTGLTPEDIAKFKTVIETLRKAKVLPLFITFIFYQMKLDASEANPIISIVHQIIALMPPQEKPLIEQMFAIKKETDQLRRDIVQIGNPKSYEKMFDRLKKTTTSFSPSNLEWLKKERWGAVSPITRSIAIQTFNELVDVYDTAIKTVKASDDVKKTQKFKEMLGPYLQMLKDWATMTVSEDNYPVHQDWPLNSYLMRIEQIFEGLSDSDPAQLDPSRDFSVNAATLGSITAFGRHPPETLEDVFTLIHQNLLTSGGILTALLFSADQIQNSLLPDSLKKAFEESLNSSVEFPAQLIGVNIDQLGITFYYNVRLRNHSGKFQLHYDRQTKKLWMEGQFLGQARARWPESASRISILDAAEMIPLKSKPKLTAQELVFTWDISDSDKMKLAFAEYQKIARISMEVLRQAYVDAFVQQIESSENLSKVVLFIEKEEQPSKYSREIMSFYVENVAQLPDNPRILLSMIGKCASRTQDLLLWSLKSRISGTKAEENRITTKLLDLFKTDLEWMQLIRQLLLIITVESQIRLNNICEILFTEDRWLTAAFDVISQGSKDTDSQVRVSSLMLLRNVLKYSQGKGTLEAIDLAREGIKDSDSQVRRNSLLLMENVVGFGEEVIAIARLGIKDSDSMVRLQSFQLVTTLIERRERLFEAITIAQEGFKDSDSIIRTQSIRLMEAVIEYSNGVGLFEAIALAQEGFKDSDSIIRTQSISLMEAVINYGNGVGLFEAIALAQEGIKSSDVMIRAHSISLMEAVIGKGEGLLEAIALAQVGIKDSSSLIREKSIELIKNVLELGGGKGFLEAIAIAQVGIKDSEPWIRRRSIVLIRKVIELSEGQGIQEAIALAQVGIKDNDFSVREQSINLLDTLIKYGKEKWFLDVFSLAREGIKVRSYSLRMQSFNSMIRMIELGQGKGIPEAIAIAQEGIKDFDSEMRSLWIELMVKVVELGQGLGIQEAIAIAQEGIHDESYWIQKKSLALMSKVIEFGQGKGISEAIALAEKGRRFHLSRSIELMANVLEFGQGAGIQEAVDIARDGLYGSLEEIHDGFDLLKKVVLLEKGKGINEVFALIQERKDSISWLEKEFVNFLIDIIETQAIETSEVLALLEQGIRRDLIDHSVLLRLPNGKLILQQLIDRDWHSWKLMYPDQIEYLARLLELKEKLEENS